MDIINKFLTIQQNIRLYHWTTDIYNQHVISGNLYEKLDGLFDKFIETYLGKYSVNYQKLKVCSIHLSPIELLNLLNEFKNYLLSDLEILLSHSNMKNNDLKNIRDEILGELNQFIFLLKMK